MYKLFFFLTTMVCLISCNQPAKSAEQQQQDNYGVEYDEEMAMTRRGYDLYMEMLKAGEAGQTLLEYGPTVLKLQQELLNYVDTCRNINKRVDCKRIAAITLVFIMKHVDAEDEAQGEYLVNTITPALNKVLDRWYVDVGDEVVVLANETYKASVLLYFFRDDPSKSYAIIEYPNDALMPDPDGFIFTSKDGVFASDAASAPDDATIDPNDKGVFVDLANEEHTLRAVMYMNIILPKMLNHKKLILLYTKYGMRAGFINIGLSELTQQLTDAQKKYHFVIP